MSSSEINEFGLPESGNDRFSPVRMLTMTRRVLRQLIRDRRTIGMITLMPIVIMVIFGVALSGEIKNVPIVVINEDQPVDYTFSPSEGVNLSLTMNAGSAIFNSLEGDDRVAVDTGFTSWQKATDQVEEGEYSAVLRIPSNFSQSIVNKLENPLFQASLQLYLDATKPAIKASILAALQAALQDALGKQSVEFDTTLAYGNAEFSGLDTSVPAVMSLVLTFLVLLISLVTIIREQLYGTLGRIYTTPLTKIERLLGFVLALAMVGMLMVFSVILIGTFVFGAEVKGNFILLLLSAFLYAIVHIFLAVFLSNFAENELQAIQFAPLIAFPSMALSGMLVPVKSLPTAAQWVSNFVPMTYGIRIFEGIMLKGFSIQQLWLDYLILNIFALIAFALASFTIKDKLD